MYQAGINASTAERICLKLCNQYVDEVCLHSNGQCQELTGSDRATSEPYEAIFVAALKCLSVSLLNEFGDE